jgi:quercetin dioxygenase-like cupin family protein
MHITRNGMETGTGAHEWFTGAVYLDTIAEPAGEFDVGAAAVHFTPAARTAWHTHPRGQTLWVTEGICLCQRRGGPIDVIRPGDRVFFEPGEEHWHGAPPDRFMAHVAIQPADEEGNVVFWGEHVTDDEYRQAPELTD